MLHSIFNPDNVVFRAIAKIGYVWYLNILWLVCSLPIVTIGASTTALIYSCMKLRHEDGYVTKNFFHSFKENFKQSTAIWLIYAVVGALLALAMIFWNNATLPFHQAAWAVVLLLVIVYVISFLYVFAIQSKFYNSIRNTIKYSFLLAYSNLGETILMGLIVFGVVALNLLTNTLVNFITLNFGFGTVAYILAGHFEKIFDVYVKAAPGQDEASSEEMSEEEEDALFASLREDGPKEE